MRNLACFYIFIFLVSSCFVMAQPGVYLDVNNYWQITVESQLNQGAKIRLQNGQSPVHLAAGTAHEQLGIDHPFISWSKDHPMGLGSVDEEGTYKEHLTFNTDGTIQVNNLQGSSTRLLTATSDGTLKPLQHFGQFTGLHTINAHNFVSYDNPGDDQNYNLGPGIIYHESQLIGDESMVAPLHLPHGVTIRQINVYYVDENAGADQDIRVYLWKRPILMPTTGILTTIGTTSGSNPAVQVLSNNTFNETVDNLLNMYYIYAAKPTDTTDWPGDQVGIVAVTVFYD